MVVEVVMVELYNPEQFAEDRVHLDPNLGSSDYGVASMLAAEYGHVLRFNAPLGGWYRWADGIWQKAQWHMVVGLVLAFVAKLREEVGLIPAGGYAKRGRPSEAERKAKAAQADANSARKDALEDCARRLSYHRSQQNILTACERHPGFWLDPFLLDGSGDVLNFLNGWVNLDQGQKGEPPALNSHGDEFAALEFITKQVPFNYDPQAECPRWRQFVDEIASGHADLVSYLKRAAGYSASGFTSEQCLFVLVGRGANGKSTFVEVLKEVLGTYASSTPSSTISHFGRPKQGVPNDIARLRGARLVSCSELEDGAKLAEQLVKEITGGERIASRFLYGEFFEFHPQFKLWLSTNHMPEITGQDEGIWRRVRILPFDAVFSGAARDPELKDKLLAEAPGILNWLIEGYREWREQGLSTPAVVGTATDNLRDELDSVREFLEGCCNIGPEEKVSKSDIGAAYRSWAFRQGYTPLGRGALRSRLLLNNRVTETRDARNRYYVGVSLKEGAA
jgi:putative DNA primase/helicase